MPISLINQLLASKTEEEYLNYLAQSAEAIYPDKVRVIIYKMDFQQMRLSKAASPTLPKYDNSPSWGFDIEDMTPTARAVYLKRPILCADVSKDPTWAPFSSELLAFNIRSAWALPIYSSDQEVLGAFSFYFDKTLDMQPTVPPLLQAFVNFAGLGMEKWKAHHAQIQAIRDLRVSEDRLHRAVKVRAMGICDYDFKSGRMVWDDTLLDIYGLARKDFTGQGSFWNKYIHPDDSVRIVRGLDTAIANRTNLDASFRIFRNGQLRHLKSSSTVSFSESGEPHRLIGLVWDITDKVVAKKKLDDERTKSIASAKMASLGEMASGIAHEINNPLTIILNRATYLRERLENNKIDLQTSAKELVKIEDTVGRIAKIIRGLSAFSRNSENDPLIECDLRSIVSDSFELCRERFAKQGIEIRLFGISKNIIINCRPSEISQVLINLMNNSFDALVGHNEKWLGIHVKELEDNVEISVIDSGLGIPEVVADKIMDPFFTTKEIGRGTGLGLSISKGIIEDHGGKLYYDRTYSNTRFVISLPVAR